MALQAERCPSRFRYRKDFPALHCMGTDCQGAVHWAWGHGRDSDTTIYTWNDEVAEHA